MILLCCTTYNKIRAIDSLVHHFLLNAAFCLKCLTCIFLFFIICWYNKKNYRNSLLIFKIHVHPRRWHYEPWTHLACLLKVKQGAFLLNNMLTALRQLQGGSILDQRVIWNFIYFMSFFLFSLIVFMNITYLHVVSSMPHCFRLRSQQLIVNIISTFASVISTKHN